MLVKKAESLFLANIKLKDDIEELIRQNYRI